MAQSTRSKPPATPRQGAQPPAAAAPRNVPPAPPGGARPRFSLPGGRGFPRIPGIPGITGSATPSGGARPPARPARRGDGLSRLDHERARERITVFVLSAVLVLSIGLIGGALLWDKVIVPQRPVARLDGQPITLREYTDTLAYRENVLLAQYQQAQQLAFQPTPAAGGGNDDFMRQFAQQRLNAIQGQLAGLSTRLVDDLVDERLLRAEATRRGISATPEEVDRELKTLVGYRDPAAASTPGTASIPVPVPGAESGAAGTPGGAAATTAPGARRTPDFQTLLRDYRRATAGTDTVIRADVEFEIIRRKLDEQLTATVSAQAEQVHARHILVGDEAAAAAARQRLANGESFEALAAELSSDPGSKEQGGDLGWFPRGFMVSAFEDAAFKLQPGQVSEPLKTSFGVHLIRVDERDSARDLDASQLQALKNNALPRWIEAEKAKHNVEHLLTPDLQEWATRNLRQPTSARA